MRLFTSLKQKIPWKWNLVLSFLVGIYAGFQIREVITQTIFLGKSFAARSPFVQFGLTLIYILLISVAVFLIFESFRKYFCKFRDYLESNIYHRVYAVLILIGIGFGLIFFYNNIFPMIDTDDWLFSNFRSFYLMDVVGLDFRTGIYRPPHMVLNHENIYVPMRSNYPPFTILFFMPLQILDENSAYLFAVFLYLIANIFSLYLIAVLVSEVLFKRLSIQKPVIYMMGISTLFVMIWYALSSYPFLFTIERGNYDSIAFLFAVLFVYFSIKKPQSIWLQVILLSIATHLKMYPAVLFVILLINHGRKIILPTILVNIILLLSLGYNNALLFIGVIIRYSLAPVTWVGNHSGFSYADFLYQTYPGLFQSVRFEQAAQAG